MLKKSARVEDVLKIKEKIKEESIDDLYTEVLLIREFATKESDSLQKLRGYALAQVYFEELIGRIDELSKSIKDQYRDLTENVLPELMEELGVPNIAISDNHEVRSTRKITASIPKPKTDEACNWLEEHGNGSLVKHTVSVSFGTKQGEAAQQAIEALKALELTPDVNRGVHHSTLTSWVKSQLEEGEEIPFELFGVYDRKVTKVSVKK